jgi:histidinol dehydrogenase
VSTEPGQAPAIMRIEARAGEEVDLAATLRRPIAEDVTVAVAETLEDVRRRGDEALVAHARRFGAPEFDADQLRTSPEAVAAATAAIEPRLRAAIEAAADQVRRVAEALTPRAAELVLDHGQRVDVRAIPVASAGCYVPAGRAPYPSSLVMSAIPAAVAGVERIVVASPPGPDGGVDPTILAAAGILGIDEVYAVGGPAAVAALAFGTESVSPVSVISGPGSSWVQEAKRQVLGQVGIDGLAGPSEVLVIADEDAQPTAVALDLLAQAEHGPDSIAVLAAVGPQIGALVEAALSEEDAPVGQIAIVECPDLETAVVLAEAFAPEHLELLVESPEAVASRIRNAGAVFLGPNGATAFGDYVAGSNHVLPTAGAARHASALGPGTYTRRMSVVEMTDESVSSLVDHLAALADAEGFPLHKRSAQIRRRDE